MINAIYAIYFTGVAGSGMGLLVFVNGVISGADAAGSTFDGEYSLDEGTGKLEGKLNLTVAAGTPLVTGGSVHNQPYTIEFPLSLSPDLGGGQPVEIRLPTGPVNVIFKKLRDIPA